MCAQILSARIKLKKDKAKRMHRTVSNLARLMILACGFPLYFSGDAVQYAAYILKRYPTRANTKRASPIEVLIETVPDLREFVVFSFLRSVYRNPRNNSLQQISTIIGK